MDRQTFAQISGIVRRKTPHGDWKSVRCMIFDAPQAEGGCEQPLAFTREWLEQQPNLYVSIIKHEVCKDEQHLRKRLGRCLGWKKIDPKAFLVSQYGRAPKYNLKVKTFQDAEAIVLERLSGSGRNIGRMGAIQFDLPNGVRFTIGSGFSDGERDNPPPIGSTMGF